MSKDLLEKIKEHLPLFDRLAARRFRDSVLADEAVVYALETLQAGGGKHFAGFSGRARFSTYLAVVVRRLFEDFSRARFGRLRPPAWIARLGGWWLELYRLLCLERLSLPEALATMENHERARQFDAEAAAGRILEEVTDCGRVRGDEQLTLDGEVDQFGGACDQPGGGGRLEHRQRELLFGVIFENLLGHGCKEERLRDSFAALIDQGVSLTPEERLLLKLCYQDDLSVSEAAGLLGLTVHQAHGKLRRLLKRLRDDFGRMGLAEELVLLLRGD